MHIKNKRGQSTVEYVLLVTAVVAVMIAFATSQNKGGLQSELNSTLNTAATDMSDKGSDLSASHAAAPSVSGTGEPTQYSVPVTPDNSGN